MFFKIFPLFFITVFLSGCASCSLQHVDKLFANKSKEVDVISPSYNTIILKIKPDIKISIKHCNKDTFCFAITLPKGQNIQLLDDNIKEISYNNKLINNYNIPYIYYEQYCYLDKKLCDERNITNEKNIIKKLNFNISNNVEKNREFIQTKSLINGGNKIKKEVSEAFYEFSNKNEYLFFVKINWQSDDKNIQLPNILIDNKVYQLPIIKISKSNENVCKFQSW